LKSTRPRAIVVVTGSELVRGDRQDLNGPFVAQELLQFMHQRFRRGSFFNVTQHRNVITRLSFL
jgi:hypothetical protein